MNLPLVISETIEHATPIIAGNVSFYNETGDSAVYPTPVIGMVGELEDMAHPTTMEFKNPGDFIVCIGSLNGKLGGSEYLKVVHNKIEGPLANIDMDYELEMQKLCLKAIQSGIINSAHDFSVGGLSINVAESILNPSLYWDVNV